MAGASGVLAVLSALAASAIALPCPVWCPQHQQGEGQGESAAPWQPLLLPPHWLLVLVPGNIRLCPPHQLSAEAPTLQTGASTTGRPVAGETGLAVTKSHTCPASVEGLLCSLLSALFTPCAGGQLGGAGGPCSPQPAVTGSSKAPPAP